MERKSDGRFAPGNKGGPGRKPKARIVTANGFRAMIGNEGIEEIVKKTVDLALEGDLQAIKVILDRIFPVYSQTQADLLQQIEELEGKISGLERKPRLVQ
jgi:hypothetical protein